MPQQLTDAAIWVGLFALLALVLEVLRRVERARVARHPSSFVEQGSCVRIYRDPRPFDYEVDS